jgi:hypothetical protein
MINRKPISTLKTRSAQTVCKRKGIKGITLTHQALHHNHLAPLPVIPHLLHQVTTIGRAKASLQASPSLQQKEQMTQIANNLLDRLTERYLKASLIFDLAK